MPLFDSGDLREDMGKYGNSTPTAITMDAIEGAKTSAVPSRASRNMSALMSSCPPITLKFMDVNYRVKTEAEKGGNLKRMFCRGGPTESGPQGSTARIEYRVILNGITGMASPGEILAVLGPSGSGKSTLLNAIAGRLHDRGLTGTILANGRRLSKPVLRRTGFVTQDDVLFPHLTVRETLVYCSLLRLPRSLTEEEKVAAADAVIAELGLGKCEHTIIGNSFIRGVSGGERKRVCIAHEMLLNPSLLVLDEPTSGLDSTAAHRLVTTLEAVAARGRTVVTSIHQPSSRVYQMFRSVLVLSEGRCMYYGKGSEAMGYFESIGYSPAFPMNPADFLLDLANGVCQTDSGICERERPNVKQSLISSYNTLLAPQIRESCLDKNTDHPSMDNNPDSIKNTKTRFSIGVLDWVNQFSVLMRRSIKERRHESFNILRVTQVLAAALLSGIMWWHSEFKNIQDRLGLLFFISIFWGVFPSFNAVFAFPQERAIFMKERASGMYSLSSYFMARIIGDMPMELILPTLFLTMTYWMSGLKPDIISFLLTLLVILGYVLVSQGLGLFIGALIMDAKQASTIVTVTMLAFVLTGGFYVHNVPTCLAWIKYISTTFYSYRLLVGIQYGDGNRISSELGCLNRPGAVDPSCKFVFEDVWGQVSPGLSVAVLLAMFFGYRVLAYLALRRIRT